MRHALLLAAWFSTVLGAVAPAAIASSPTVTTIVPRGAKRGTTVDVIVSGRRLHDAEAIVFYRAGLRATLRGKPTDRMLRARIAIAANCEPGEVAFRVRTSRGLSEVRTFWVGSLDAVPEVEPNDLVPQRLRREVTVHGALGANDRDVFSVVLRRGERLSAEITGIRLADTLLDAALTIIGPDGREVIRVDDTSLLQQDPHATIIAPRDGTYRIEVVEATHAGGSTARYLLHVGAFRRPVIAFPAGGRPGETIDVRFLGDAAGTIAGRVTLPRYEGEYRYEFRDEHGAAPAPLRFRVSDLVATRDVEPNNSIKAATPIAVPGAVDGRIDRPRDIDWFKFRAKKNEWVELQVFGRALRSPIDPVLSVRRSKGGNLAYSDDAAGRTDSVTRFRPATDGDYYVAVRDHRSRGGERFVYRLEIRRAAPRLTAKWSRFARSGQALQTIAVPAGNRDATMIDVTRANHSAPVRTLVRDLPRGVSAHSVTLPRGATRIPIVFEAAEGAPRGTSFAEVRTEATVGKRTIHGSFEHEAQLLIRLNNRTFWACELDRMPIAVTKPVGFSVEIVEPTTPLVRNGRLRLRVKVKRSRGFKGSVILSMLYRPAGVGASSSVTVRPDRTEGVFYMSANSRAALGSWPIVVRARATVDRGTVWIASRIATLDIATSMASLSFARAKIVPGESVDVTCRLTGTKGLKNPATIKLLGLPRGAAADPVVVKPGQTRVTVRVRSTKDLEPGRYRTIYGQLICKHAGGTVDHRSGRLDLRVPPPLKPKTAPGETP